MKIAFLSSEVAPLAKTGGLGDVAGALPKALKKLNIDARVFMPFYGLVDKSKYKVKKVASAAVFIREKSEAFGIWQTELPNSSVKVYLIKHRLFNGKEIYVSGRIMKGKKYTRAKNDVERFSFFTQSALEACKALDFQPDVVHAQDWHTALAADMIKTRNLSDNFFIKTKVLYTIHNLANQGISDPQIIRYAKISPDFPVIKADAENGDINFMVQGILMSDLVNTVSPRYAVEILYHYQGAGLDNILRKRKKDLYGILNGIDTDFFNPKNDKYIKYQYGREDVFKKKNNKVALQKELGLTQDENINLVGFVSRLVWQKGSELITEDMIENLNCQFVFLGTGQKEYEDYLKRLAKKYPKKISANIFFDAALAQKIYAASDIFLVPSRFEPCGLTQMIAMRYGSVPVVRATGGLDDTVDGSVGFKFKKYSSAVLEKILAKALDVYYYDQEHWLKLQKNGMKKDFSWDKSARDYLRLYQKLVARKY